MMKILKRLAVVALFTPAISYAANEPRLLQGVKNVDKIASAGGSTIFTILLAAAILLLLTGIGTWAWSSKPNSNAPAGAGKFAMISFVCAMILFGGTAWLGLGGEIFDVNQTVDYRNLSTQASK
ncbi:hypothetical protein ABMX62_19440 [Vibrio vulnificus]|uniref:hypothetical protein n=1 Tax=Vibrio vulnificus TaxID=672 RepID=UPI004059EFCB